MNFKTLFEKGSFILTEGAIVERLKSECHQELDTYVNHAGLIYNNDQTLANIYEEYIEIAKKHSIPIMLMTPTRKVNSESLTKSSFSDKNIIEDSCEFLFNIKNKYKRSFNKIYVGGLLGCKGDAYSAVGIGIEEAYKFHKVQVDKFTKSNVDFLFAGIMPVLSEAIGMAKAMSESNIPYIISFMIKKDGKLIDQTSIAKAIKTIDALTEIKPLCYMTNCVHPLNLKLALQNKINGEKDILERFAGIQANASVMEPEELNNCGCLKQGDFSEMIKEMKFLKDKFGLKIFGGCCGTNDIFIEKLAAMLNHD